MIIHDDPSQQVYRGEPEKMRSNYGKWIILLEYMGVSVSFLYVQHYWSNIKTRMAMLSIL